MFEGDSYPSSNVTISRTFYFPRPMVTTKVKLDNIKGAETIAIKIEFLGIDTETKHKVQAPFSGGTVFASKSLLKLVFR